MPPHRLGKRCLLGNKSLQWIRTDDGLAGVKGKNSLSWRLPQLASQPSIKYCPLVNKCGIQQDSNTNKVAISSGRWLGWYHQQIWCKIFLRSPPPLHHTGMTLQLASHQGSAWKRDPIRTSPIHSGACIPSAQVYCTWWLNSGQVHYIRLNSHPTSVWDEEGEKNLSPLWYCSFEHWVRWGNQCARYVPFVLSVRIVFNIHLKGIVLVKFG